MSGDGSVAVLADAQFSTVRILKPFPNFEAVYQGQETSIPIAFPGVLDEDAIAGTPGFSPNLIAGISMPMGCQVIIWIPQTIFGYNSLQRYTYQICWRLRSPQDFTNDIVKGRSFGAQSTYSLPEQEVGVPGGGQKRYVLPAAMNSISYQQAEPGTDLTNGAINLRGQLLTTNGALWDSPLTPNGNRAQITQGIFGDATSPTGSNVGGGPVFFPFIVQSQGNEMFILAQRETVTPGQLWDFADEADDRSFSNTFGTNNGTRAPVETVGIYVLTGTAP